MGVETLPSGHAADHSYLKKDQCDRKAASHPLPVLLNLTFENEDHRSASSNHPQRGVHRGGNTERSWNAHAFLEVLDIEAEGRCHEHTGNVDSPDHPMKLPETLTKAIGELHRAQQQSARAGDSMWRQPPLKGFIVLPQRILRMHQKTLIVRDNVGQHQGDEANQKILWAQPGGARMQVVTRVHGANLLGSVRSGPVAAVAENRCIKCSLAEPKRARR